MMSRKHLIPAAVWLCIVIPLAMSADCARGAAHWILALQFSMIVISRERRGVTFYLQPSFLVLSYISVSMIAGSLGFAHGYMREDYFADYVQWRDYDLILSYILACNAVMFTIGELSAPGIRSFPRSQRSLLTVAHPGHVAIAGVVLMAIGIAVPIDLRLIGGEGNGAYWIVAFGYYLAVLAIAPTRSSSRYLFYVMLIASVAAVSSEDKRNAIFLIFPTVLADVIHHPPRITIRAIAGAALAAIFVFAAICAMSIGRGYGEYPVTSALSALPYLLDYVRTDNFITYFLQNIEASYVFYHASDAIHRISSGQHELTMGATMARALFVGPVGDIAGFKPDSIITSYTGAYDADYLASGGSCPIIVYAEMFWNFSWFGLLPLIAIYSASNAIFWNTVKWVSRADIGRALAGMASYHFGMEYARGSGLDMYVISMIFFAIVLVTIYPLVYPLLSAKVGSKCAQLPSWHRAV